MLFKINSDDEHCDSSLTYPTLTFVGPASVQLKMVEIGLYLLYRDENRHKLKS